MTATYGTIAKVAFGTRANTVQTLPASTVDGNFLLWQLVTGGTNPITPTFPAGWTVLGTAQTGDDAAGFDWVCNTAVRRAASEPASYTSTHASTGCESLMVRVTGSGTLSIDVFSQYDHEVAGLADGGLTTTANSVTTTAANDLLLFTGLNWDVVALTPPSGMTERQDSSFIYLASQALGAAGATGNKTQTHGGNPWYGNLYAIKDVAPVGRLKVWNGSAWVEKPTKVWTGSAWVEKPVKFWNGSTWVLA